MPRKHHKPEEIVSKLRQVDVLVSQGQSVADAVRAIGVTEVTDYRWRQEYGGLKSDQVRTMKELEAENARLKKLLTVTEDADGGVMVGAYGSDVRKTLSAYRLYCRSMVRNISLAPGK